ncbi:MAG TPA: MFS transporter [Elusimicrobiota bacterium]|nr:MFS transporter [Elusimicrobiota bacterium]
MAPEAAAQKRVPLGGLLGGAFVSELANSALHLAQPLLILKLSGSFGDAALFAAFDTAVHMAGTFAGGWPADRIGARRLLILSTLLRAAALALIPIAWAAGALTLGRAMAAYTADALVRGFTDAAVHTVPLELGENDPKKLDRINSRYELAYEIGGVAGPLMLGAFMLWMKGVAVQAAVPVGFAAAALIFTAIPQQPRAAKRSDESCGGGSLAGLRLALTDKTLLLACVGLALLNLYPLRKLFSAFFAKGILHSPAAAGWLGAAFALGGVGGALLYGRFPDLGSAASWIALGAAGSVSLAAGWIPGGLAVMMAAAFFFSLANAGARLSLTRRLQEATPLEAAGGVTAASRLGANAASVLLKAIMGAAFALGAGMRISFGLVGAGVGILALAQLVLASRVAGEDAARTTAASAVGGVRHPEGAAGCAQESGVVV